MIESNDYRITLDAYSGPLDLLLFLIRRDEVDIYDIPIARVTSQYLEYVELLKVIDPDAIGEFLVLAATLMEIKSRLLLPKPPPEEIEQEFVDPRLELVHQLLEYKKYKDAAHTLEDAAQVRSEKHARQPVLPPRDPNELELENLDIWDLFEAFNKLLKQIGKAGASYKIDIDDTPISLHAEDVLDSLERVGGQQRFEEVFTGRTLGEMIGLFLALLELIRQRRVRATQDRPFGPISLVLLDRTPLDEIPDELPQADHAQSPTGGDDESSWTGELAESEADPLTADDDLGEEFNVPDVPGLDDVTIIEAELDRDALPLPKHEMKQPATNPDPKENSPNPDQPGPDSQPEHAKTGADSQSENTKGLSQNRAATVRERENSASRTGVETPPECGTGIVPVVSESPQSPDNDDDLPDGVALIRPNKTDDSEDNRNETQ